MTWLALAIFAAGLICGGGLVAFWAAWRRRNEQTAYRLAYWQAQQWADLCALLRRKGWQVITPGLVAALTECLHNHGEDRGEEA